MKNLEDDRNYNVAKNIILFIGDGMGMTTVTTARILRGQKQGQTGEENELAFDKFEYVALAKTYNTDSQVGDSGACATALLCGVKGRFETVGLDDSGIYEKCESSFQSRIPCLADWAQAEDIVHSPGAGITFECGTLQAIPITASNFDVHFPPQRESPELW
ncbi:alkaline phosphatase, tissue-nonspecific isozyme [Trichonephila clavipes]|nr:alkaline phosphatase, tissue-nonspecific isozyme [Trichonephila clavipes]